MLRLNDDCLSLIFDRMSLRNQLRLISVNQRFYDIIVSVQWRSRFRHFVTTGNDDTHTLSREEFQSLFELIAQKIEHLVITEQVQDSLFDRNVNPWRAELGFYLRFEFPMLRVLEYDIDGSSVRDMELLATHSCPNMRHLRKLHLPKCYLDAHNLKLILTALPLTELSCKEFLMVDARIFAELLVGASTLQIFRMEFNLKMNDFIECMTDLASTSVRRNPLTVHIICNDRRGYTYVCFEICKCALQPLVNNQLTNPTHIYLRNNSIECRFFLPIE